MQDTVSKEKEKQIILAAREFFARYGFSKTTMEDIAGEIGMGKASLYYYFPTKESLFQVVISQEMDEFMEKLACLLKIQTSAAQKLRTYVEERLKFFQSLVNLGMLSYYTFLEKKTVHKKMSDEFGNREIEVIKGIVEEGKNNGEFRGDINAEVADLLIHLIQGLRLRTIKSMTHSRLEGKSYEELHHEMMLTIDIFIMGIGKY